MYVQHFFCMQAVIPEGFPFSLSKTHLRNVKVNTCMFWFVLFSVDAFCKLFDGKKYFMVLSFQL